MATIKYHFIVLSMVLMLVPTVVMAESSLEVKNLSISFPSKTEIRVQGMLRCNNIRPSYLINPGGEVEVNVDFPDEKGDFALLPDRFQGHYITPLDRHLSIPFYVHKGKKYVIGKTKQKFFRSTLNAWPPIIDKILDNVKDEGHWIPFDKTLSFRSPMSNYRVLIEWKLDYLACPSGDEGYLFFAHYYYWVVYGPFPWGEAPACSEKLIAKQRQPVFFTKKGVKITEPIVSEKDDQPEETSDDTSEPKREKLVRKGRPSHLDAVNAGNQLEQTLARLKGIQRAGVMVTPRSATVSLFLDDNQAPDIVTQLIVKAFLETADAISWIESISIQAQGRSVTTTWESVAKYVAGEITLIEFQETWK